ncbi:tetratricopeptide repeat protein [Methanosarcina sp.]|uniref:tetratricopeptide repeat protein n=1 Tax=Methanosarcina sp. TaxID=2213 RepID=UPI002ABCED1B|nr:tetratricopeptide repeat protein [Methanosarcina sp.]MDY9926811.1 tetratricopeptide repeat protein [Methanosarcina sp.]
MPIGSTTYFGKERIFVDRDACIQAFRENIQKLETQEYNVLFFHGIAGIGKSKLQKELQNILDKEYPEIFWTSIDLNTKTNREVGTFLVALRNKIQEKCKANFYLFDIAHAIYWKKLHPEIPLPQENYPLIKEEGFFSKVIDVLNEFGPARLAWDILKNAPENVKRSLKEQAIDINKLADMEVHELEKLLPSFFAADFTNYLGTDSKAYIFIDTYEALWDGLRNKGSFHEKDEWIRDNLIPNMSGVSWVICGREPLLWDKFDSDWKIYLEQHLVDGLPESYCQEFLEDCGIENKDIRDIIIKVSEGVPYYLNLSVDTYEKISRSRQPAFEDFGKAQPEVFNTFVKYLRSNEIQALTVLSVPNQWDRDLFEVLMKKFYTELPISTFSELIKFSFIKTYTEGKYSIQQLMRKNLQAYQDPVGRENINKFMLEYYSNRLKDIDIKAITSEHEIALTEAFYHAKEALGAEELFEWFISISAPFFRAAFWQLISPFYEEMLQILKAELGSEHSDVAATLNYLGLLYTNMGDYEKALPLYKRALEINEKVLGPKHSDVTNTLNNLALLYYQMGDYEKALSLYKRALEIAEKVLGPQHPNVANTLNNLAELYYQMGDYEKALSLYKTALDIREKVLGPQHPDVANTLNNLALLYYQMGDYEKALSLYKRALEIAEKVLGPQHPNVANTLNNLAELYYQMGDYEKALSLYKTALDIREKVLGPQHPDVANTLNNLALLYSQLEDYEKALPLCQRALETREKLLGPQHPLTATSLNNLAVLYCQTRKYEEALQLSIQALRIVEKMLGSQHPEVAIILSNRAEIYEAQGKYHEAEQLFNRALEITTKILGFEHSNVVFILDNLVSIYRKTGESEKELIFSTRANEIRNKIIQKEISFDLQDSNPNTSEIVSEIKELIWTTLELIANHEYLQARILLENIVKLPEYQKSIEEEFGFLYDFATSSEEDERNVFKKIELVEYQSNLWYVLSDRSTFSLKKEIVIKEEPKKVDEAYETKDESTENSFLVESLKEIKNKKLDGTPQEKGEILENAVIELFREFFIIAEDYDVKQQELRKQKAGLQFGFDVSLKCSLEENMNVKCHIECKNITETITLANVADKLLQTEDSYPNTDHWILICPTAEPTNELHQKVSQWNDTRRFPFNIQIWSKNIIEELFGLNPNVYDLFFEPREGEVHPSQWTPEKRIRVFGKWKDKLKPLIRLPTEWDHYMREPYLMCFKGEDQKELDFLYQNHVQMECTDERKNILNQIACGHPTLKDGVC